MSITLTRAERRFIGAYFEALHFTEDSAGRELCEVFKREQTIECLAFLVSMECYLNDSNLEQAGHDFWFSRNGHGVGFWERGGDVYLPHVRDWCQKKAEKFAEVEPIYSDLEDVA